MDSLRVPKPVSAGVILSYKCSSECKHCMYACSPKWKDNWISHEDLKRILIQLSGTIKGSFLGSKNVEVNSGLHFTGGEPFLNFNLLLTAVKMANELKIPSTFVETNCFWCISRENVREKLEQLRKEGLNGILISVNPFLLEQIPFERTEIAIIASREVFGRNVMVYQEFFYHQFRNLRLKGTLPLKAYLKSHPSSLNYVELIPMGRTSYRLEYLFKKYKSKYFFGQSCKGELTRNWHVHVDYDCNYMPGYCGGLSLGDARELDAICREGVDLRAYPVLKALVTDIKNLYSFAVNNFGYEESHEGYVSKCHLCIDIRKHIVRETNEFPELSPREFYDHL